MKEEKNIHRHNIICKKELMCWLNNISDIFEVKKDLGNGNFQVFFISSWSTKQLKEHYGVSLGWVTDVDRG